MSNAGEGRMEIQVLGVGNAFTSRYYNTSFLIRSEQLLLIDCPQALFRLLREIGVDPRLIDRVLVTHIHGDHTSGLETLLLWKKYVARSKLTICTGRRVWEEIKTRFFPSFSATFTPDLEDIQETALEDYADFCELEEDRENQLIDGLKVAFRYNWHPTPTLGLKLISPHGTVGISGDTCYRPALLKRLLERGTLNAGRYQKLAGDWLWKSDVIYHEVERGEAGAHTAEAELLALPADIRARIRLIHLADDFEESPLALARQGEILRFEDLRK
ncbi:MAG: MBL fold metallo-hydrolase [Acidobacteria bacterium]|nr:MAG: MBL fold metallo-hydrolase [Acidobacteriota bacterium]